MTAVHPSQLFTIDATGALVLTMPDPVEARLGPLDADALLDECAAHAIRWADAVPRAAIDVRFDHVEVAPSYLLGWLIMLKRDVSERGASFRLSGLQPRVRKAVSIVALDGFLNVVPPPAA